MSTGKKIALGVGGAAALLGAGLLGHRLGDRKMSKVAAKKIHELTNNQKVHNAIKSASENSRSAIAPSAVKKAISSAAKNAAQKTINYANASDFKKALNDPNHVWDI